MDKRFALTDDQLEAVAGGLLDEAAEVVKSELDPMERAEEDSFPMGAIIAE